LTEGLRLGTPDKPGELHPILPSDLTSRLFRELQRVNYHFDLDTPWSWYALTNRLLETPQPLCVLNTRANHDRPRPICCGKKKADLLDDRAATRSRLQEDGDLPRQPDDESSGRRKRTDI
jgi:hypothetical protein